MEFLKYTTGPWYEGEYRYDDTTNLECEKRYPIRNLGFPKLYREKPWNRVKSNPRDIKEAVAKQPITTAIMLQGLILYKSGILDE